MLTLFKEYDVVKNNIQNIILIDTF